MKYYTSEMQFVTHSQAVAMETQGVDQHHIQARYAADMANMT